MTRPRMSIATMMSLNALFAIDWFLVHEIYDGSQCEWAWGTGCYAAGMFLMVQILPLGPIRILLRRGNRPPFAVGFAILGIAAIIAYRLLFSFFPGSMYAVIDFSGQPISTFCETFLPAPGSLSWFSNRIPLEPSMMWYHFQSQPDAIEPLLVVFFMVLVTTPFAVAQLLIALAGGFAVRFLVRHGPVGID